MKTTKLLLHLFLSTILLLSARQAFAFTPDYQDWWWNPAQSGMGINIGQNDDTLVIAWYHFDNKGQATYLMFSGPLAENRLSSTLYRTAGPAPGPGYDRADVHSTAVGTATIDFLSSGEATLSYEYDGQAGSIILQRFLYSELPHDAYVLMLSGGPLDSDGECLDLWYQAHLGREIFLGQSIFQTKLQLQKTGDNTYDLSFSLVDEKYDPRITNEKQYVFSAWCTTKSIPLKTENGIYSANCQLTTFRPPPDIVVGSIPFIDHPEFAVFDSDVTLTIKNLKIDEHNSLFDFILDFDSTTAQICQIHAEHMTVNTPHGYYWRTEEEKNALIKVCESYPNPKPDEGIKTITLPSGCTVSGYTEGIAVPVTP